MKFLLTPAAVLVLLISCSGENSRRSGDTGMAAGAPGGMSTHDTMTAAPANTGAVGGNAEATPAAVLSQMNVSNTMEIQLSRVAIKKASSPQVRKIAQTLQAHHEKNREQVRSLAQQVNVTLTPAQGGSVSSSDSAAMPRDLQTMSGAGFDKAFIQYQIDAHEANIDRLQNQTIPAIEDQQVKAYLQQTLTAMQNHLASLQQVQQQLGS